LTSTSTSAKPAGSAAGHRGDRGGVAHVELERQQRVAELGGERIQAILATGGGDHAVAAFDEAARDGGAEAGGGAGDEDDHG
jgi:hypothetical protein